MPQGFYEFANIFFFAFHTFIVLFNTFGWLFRKLRLYNLITLLLTAFSWFFLGIWYGWGYCFCTDWHWTVREKLGYEAITNSYIDLLLIKLTGLDLPNDLVNTGTVVIFAISLVLSLILNAKNYFAKRK